MERDSIEIQKAKDSINVNAAISKEVTFKYRYNLTILLIIVGILSILLYFFEKNNELRHKKKKTLRDDQSS